jgi:hypothetical protein
MNRGKAGDSTRYRVSLCLLFSVVRWQVFSAYGLVIVSPDTVASVL